MPFIREKTGKTRDSRGGRRTDSHFESAIGYDVLRGSSWLAGAADLLVERLRAARSAHRRRSRTVLSRSEHSSSETLRPRNHPSSPHRATADQRPQVMMTNNRSIGVNHGGGGNASPTHKNYGSDGYITVPKYGWLPGQPARLQHAFF